MTQQTKISGEFITGFFEQPVQTINVLAEAEVSAEQVAENIQEYIISFVNTITQETKGFELNLGEAYAIHEVVVEAEENNVKLTLETFTTALAEKENTERVVEVLNLFA